ncbi:hypothetical protein BRADI_3g26638v3, partial [Brachypodium distachyon]
SKARDQTNTQSHSLCAATARSRFGLPQLGVVMSTTNSTTDLPVAMTGAAGCPLLRPEHSTVLGERNFHTYEQEQLHQDFSLVVTYAGPRRRFSPQDITAAIVGASPLIPANAFRGPVLSNQRWRKQLLEKDRAGNCQKPRGPWRIVMAGRASWRAHRLFPDQT